MYSDRFWALKTLPVLIDMMAVGYCGGRMDGWMIRGFVAVV